MELNYLEDYWPCADGLSAANAIDITQVARPDKLRTDPMAYDGINKSGKYLFSLFSLHFTTIYYVAHEGRWDHLRRNAGAVHKTVGMGGRRFRYLSRHSAFGFRRSGDAGGGAIS